MYNFNKYNVSDFNKATSVDSKLDILNKCYKYFKKLGVKSKTKERKQKKITVLKNVLFLYHELSSIYKKEYNQKLLESTKKDIDQDKDGENVPKSESIRKLESITIINKHLKYNLLS